MAKIELGPKDKRPAPHGYGFYFEHTKPQRRVPCLVGNMLAPASADDIPPISKADADAVSRAFDLLAQLVGDRDHNLFLGDADRDGRATAEAQAIARIKVGVMAILRVDGGYSCACSRDKCQHPDQHACKLMCALGKHVASCRWCKSIAGVIHG